MDESENMIDQFEENLRRLRKDWRCHMSQKMRCRYAEYQDRIVSLAELGYFDDCSARLADEGYLKVEELTADIDDVRRNIADALTQVYFDTAWALFDVDGTGMWEIERMNDVGLFDDDDALAYVKLRAAFGSQKHIEALEVHNKHEVGLMRYRLEK